jgi:hypothetical protein
LFKHFLYYVSEVSDLLMSISLFISLSHPIFSFCLPFLEYKSYQQAEVQGWERRYMKHLGRMPTDVKGNRIEGVSEGSYMLSAYMRVQGTEGDEGCRTATACTNHSCLGFELAFMLAKKAFYHLSHTSSSFCSVILEIDLENYLPGWPQISILPYSAF